MTLGMMLLSLFIGALLTIAAAALHRAERSANRPVRWMWVGMMACTVVLTIALPARAPERLPVPRYLPTRVVTEADVVANGPVAWWAAGVARVNEARAVITAPLVAIARRSVAPGASVQRAAALAWGVLSAGCIVLLLVTYRRVQRQRRAWPRARLLDQPVRLSDAAGPAVVGLRPMEIVVPTWILARSRDEQGLVLAHETEHVRARDPWLLAGGCALVAAMPWNPFLWYGLSRLRLAVELDCDRRVLQRGATPLSYGQLLLELSAQPSTLGRALPALAYNTSHLERRLLAMTTRPSRFATVRRTTGALVAGVALLAACESKLPTSAEIDAMDAKSATAQASRLAIADSASTEYTVDGRRVSATEAQSVAAGQIASIRVVKDSNRTARVQLRTTRGTDTLALTASRIALTDSTATDADAAVSARAVGGRVRVRSVRQPDSAMVATEARGNRVRVSNTFQGLFIIDGRTATEADMNALQPSRIESIEVVKGAAATKLFTDPRAAGGVIVVKTKR